MGSGKKSADIKLLMVINSLILAGAEVLVADLVPRLAARGIEVTVAVLKPLNSPLEAKLRDAGTKFLPSGPKIIYSPLHVFHLQKHARDFDLVHVHLFPAQLWVALARRRAEKRPVLLVTEHSHENNRRKPWLRWIDAWVYGRYHHIACNSHTTKTRLQEWLPQLAIETSVVPNGIAVSRFRDAQPLSKRTLIGAENAPLLISVARMQPQKDHATLLKAFAQLPSEAHLALVGDGELKPTLQAMASQLGVSSRVHFLGRRADVPQLLKTADVFVHATHAEGFGLSALEAMATGLPVVASRVQGLSEVVGGAGVLVPPHDPPALAAAIRSLLASPELRQTLSLAGVHRANEFDVEVSADLYADLYRKLLSSAPVVR